MSWARRGDKRRIAHVLADARRLEQRLVELVQRVHHLELAEKVREHAARYLIVETLCVGAHRDGVERAVSDILGADRLEVVGDLVQELLVEVNAVIQFLECSSKASRSRAGTCRRRREEMAVSITSAPASMPFR